MPIPEEELRRALDERGILRPGAVREPRPESSFLVFGQAKSVAIPLSALEANANRFFATKLGLSVEKNYLAGYDAEEDAANVILSGDALRAVRLLYVRKVSEGDRMRAERADATGGASGMFDLTRRCETAWIVDSEGEGDRAALLLAAVLASVVLGPIVPPTGDELFGVRTARLRLEQRSSVFR